MTAEQNLLLQFDKTMRARLRSAAHFLLPPSQPGVTTKLMLCHRNANDNLTNNICAPPHKSASGA